MFQFGLKELEVAEIVDSLRGLIAQGFVEADSNCFCDEDDMEEVNFRINSGYSKDLKDAIDPKPVVIADIGGFWKPLLDLFAHMRERQFIQLPFEVRYLVAEKIEDILPMIETAAAKAAVLGTRKETIDERL